MKTVKSEKIVDRLRKYESQKEPRLFTFSSLPRMNSAKEEVITIGARSFVPGRNILDALFKHYSKDGQVKREHLKHRSSSQYEYVYDECKLMSYCNL